MNAITIGPALGVKRGATPLTSKAPESQYEAAFARAYEEYYGKLFAFTYSRTRDAELSKDIVASVFERAYVRATRCANRPPTGPGSS